MGAGSRREESRDAVIDATRLSLVRVALAFGLANAAVPVIVLATGDGEPTDLVLAVAWAAAWGLATLNARSLLALLLNSRARWLLALVGALATALTVHATGGLDSPIKTGANWLGWAATVVVSARVALLMAGIFSTALTAAFMFNGASFLDLLTGPDRYTVITGIANPFVIVVIALSLAGVFQSVIAAAPGTLWTIRRGGPASSPAMSALLSGDTVAVPMLVAGRDEPEPDIDEATATQTALSDRERDIVALLADGLVPKEVARTIGRSTDAVYDAIRSAKRKTGAATIDHLIALTWRPA